MLNFLPPEYINLLKRVVDDQSYPEYQNEIKELYDFISKLKTDYEVDVKVLRDIDVLSATKDSTNSKKVTLNLSSELYKNSAYSLIWVMWAEWNIDFEIGETFTWEKINPNFYNEEKIIEKIVIINCKIYFIYYECKNDY